MPSEISVGKLPSELLVELLKRHVRLDPRVLVGLVIDESAILVLPECERLCRHFGLNPMGLIGSGSLLIAAVIGEVLAQDSGCLLQASDGTARPLPQFDRDEITRLFC